MDNNADNTETQITLLPYLLKIFAMFHMRQWYHKEKADKNVVETIAIRCSNCGKATDIYMKSKNEMTKKRSLNLF